jgi:ATP-binding cassette, subfamily B, bacterial MsbA
MTKTTGSRIDWDLLKRLIPYIKPHRIRLITGILFGVLYGAASFGFLAALGWAVGLISGENLSDSGFDLFRAATENDQQLQLSQVIRTLIILPGIAIFQGITFFASKYYVEWTGNRVIADIRMDLFRHIHSLPMQFFTQSRSGELISRLTNDTGAMTNLVANVIADAIRSPFNLIGSIAFMFYADWKLTLLALFVFPLCIAPIALISRRIRKASKRGQENLGDLLSVTQESITGAIIVKAFQTEEEEADRFNIFNSQVFKLTMKATRGLALGEPLMTAASAIGLVGIVIYSYQTGLTLATIITFAAAMINMYKPAKKLSQLHMSISRTIPSVERVFEILDTDQVIKDEPDALVFNEEIKTVEFKNVEFSYEKNEVLKKVNLKAFAGQTIAFVGSSGAGKTTLVNLIPRFFDVTGGAIEINGKNIRSYTVQSLRRQMGIVTQQTILFNRSVAENIAYGSNNVTPEQIEEAAKRANAHPFISELENGYDTIIGERGSLLSGGMAQRLCIARALLRNPPILILDEATSALDNESEQLVQEALNELMKNRTVFVIAHRLSTIKHADQIIVMDKGEIVQRGTHDELLTAGGKYKYFYDMQFSKKEGEQTNG